MTMTRREFIAVGATALTVAGMAGTAFASIVSTPDQKRVLPFRVIFDERFSESRLFAQQALGAGVITAAIRDDVSALWFSELRPRLEQGAVAIAGMTTATSLFCLEQFASDYWMKVQVRTEHPQALVAWLIAPNNQNRNAV